MKYLANKQKYKLNTESSVAIHRAAIKYKLNVEELLSIAIVESGLNHTNRIKLNKNGSFDIGLFQINSVNIKNCSEYNLLSTDGSTFCAAKLLFKLKQTHVNYIGNYHSKTPTKNKQYMKKITYIMTQFMLEY